MPPRKRVRIDYDLTVRELADVLEIGTPHVIKALFMRGLMRTADQRVDKKFAKAAATDLGFDADDDGSDGRQNTLVPKKPIAPSGESSAAMQEPTSEDSQESSQN